jgi:hypothetical protein
LLLLPVSGQSAIVAQYSFDSDFSSSDTESLTTAGDFLGQATGGFSGEFGVLGTPAGASSQTDAWSARAERDATDSFFEFTISLGTGASQISFTSLTFDAYAFQTIVGPTAFDYALYWDADGFAGAIGSATGPSLTATPNTQNANLSLSFDLSGLPARTTDVTFRFDPVFGSGSLQNGGGAVASSQRGGAVDNVILNATISAAQVPLPSTPALFLAAGIAAGIARLRRSRGGARCGWLADE